MTPHRHWFRSYSPHVVPVRLANDAVIQSAGLGSVEFQLLANGEKMRPVVFHDVLHVPALGSNLLSVYHLSRLKGYHCDIQSASARFSRDGELLFTATVNERNTGYLDGYTIIPPPQAANLATASPLDINLWHRRFAHLNYHDLELLRDKKLVTGLTLHSSTPPDPICEPCIAGKQHRHNVPRSASHPSTLLAYVVSDLKGPLPVASKEGYRYWITFTCVATRFLTVAFLRNKSDAFEAFKSYKAFAENALDAKIKVFSDDKGGEYIGKQWESYFAEHGIQHQRTETDEPYQNGMQSEPIGL